MPEYEGLQLNYPDGRTTNVIGVPENIPHYYASGKLQVVAVRYDSKDRLPDDPPAEYQAPGYSRSTPGGMKGWPEPHASQRNDGSVATRGWLPDGIWVEVQPARELTEAERGAKAFHDALADPSSLVAKATPDKLTAFVTAVTQAVQALGS